MGTTLSVWWRSAETGDQIVVEKSNDLLDTLVRNNEHILLSRALLHRAWCVKEQNRALLAAAVHNRAACARVLLLRRLRSPGCACIDAARNGACAGGEENTSAKCRSGDHCERRALAAVLWCAALHNSVEVAQTLLSAHALTTSAWTNNDAVCRIGQRQEEALVDVDYVNDHWGSSLTVAARGGHVRCVTLLLANGANANVADAVWGYTPLMRAAAAGHRDVVQILLRAGANPRLRAADNCTTALSLALGAGHGAIARQLMIAH